MTADAIALLRPKNPDALRPLLDLDDDDESDGLYAEELEDGAFLVHTFQPFAVFQADLDEGRVWLSQLGDAGAHVDPRGVLFFPDTHEPEARTYDDAVNELLPHGVFVPAAPLTREEAANRKATLARERLDAERMIAALTGEGGASTNDLSTSFGAARMIEDVQKQVMAALGLAGATDAGDHVVVLVKRKTELDVDEDDVADAYRLDDGAVALHTLVPLASRESLVADLRAARAGWVAEHDDPRGVPTFVSALLDDLTDVTSYDEVLARLGDKVTFVRLD